MEPFGFDQIPEVLRQLFEKVEKIETFLMDEKTPSGSFEKMLNVQEAANYLDTTVQALYSMVSRKEIPVNKPGKRLYFDKDELTAWIKNGRRKTISEINNESTSSRRRINW